jgi:hypothetical protein
MAYKVVSAAVKVGYDSSVCFYSEQDVYNAWVKAYSTEHAFLNTACQTLLPKSYTDGTLPDATKHALNDLKTALNGKSLTIDVNGAVYRPGSTSHTGRTGSLVTMSSTPPSHHVMLGTQQFDVRPLVEVVLA